MDAMLFNFENDYDNEQYYLYDHLENEYWPYVAKTPMTTKERRALRKWVRSGHSVYESPGSEYLGESSVPVPFLDIYRMDEEFRKDMKGMNPEMRSKYMREVTGWETTEEERIKEEAKRQTPELVKEEFKKNSRELFYLWEYLYSKGLMEEARKYVDDHMDQETPFEFDWISHGAGTESRDSTLAL